MEKRDWWVGDAGVKLLARDVVRERTNFLLLSDVYVSFHKELIVAIPCQITTNPEKA